MAAPSRILHLIDTGGPGGAETILESLVTGFPNERWRSRVVVPEIDWLHKRLEDAGKEVRVIPSRGSANLRFLAGICSQIRDFRPNLLHSHLLAPGVYGSLAASLSGGAPLVHTFHGTPDVDPRDRFLPAKARILSRACNRMVYVSRDLRGQLEARLGVPARLGRVIHNGVEFVDHRADGTLRRELGVGVDRLIVGAVGNLREAKDYPSLLQTARIAGAFRDDLLFVVIGGGPERLKRDLFDLRDQLGLRDRVHFLGFRPDALRLLGDFDLYVSSSSSEGLPLATLEAMGMGLPVVLTACGGPAEIVRHGTTGLLVPPRDPEALAHGILRLVSSPSEAGRLAEAGRADVRVRFSRRTMVDRYLSLYREVLHGR